MHKGQLVKVLSGLFEGKTAEIKDINETSVLLKFESGVHGLLDQDDVRPLCRVRIEAVMQRAYDRLWRQLSRPTVWLQLELCESTIPFRVSHFPPIPPPEDIREASNLVAFARREAGQHGRGSGYASQMPICPFCDTVIRGVVEAYEKAQTIVRGWTTRAVCPVCKSRVDVHIDVVVRYRTRMSEPS